MGGTTGQRIAFHSRARRCSAGRAKLERARNARVIEHQPVDVEIVSDGIHSETNA